LDKALLIDRSGFFQQESGTLCKNKFSAALSEALSKHIGLSPARREPVWLAFLIMQHKTICLWRLAAYVAT